MIDHVETKEGARMPKQKRTTRPPLREVPRAEDFPGVKFVVETEQSRDGKVVKAKYLDAATRKCLAVTNGKELGQEAPSPAPLMADAGTEHSDRSDCRDAARRSVEAILEIEGLKERIEALTVVIKRLENTLATQEPLSLRRNLLQRGLSKVRT